MGRAGEGLAAPRPLPRMRQHPEKPIARKKALWFFINLYLVDDKNKEVVVKSLLMYDKIFKVEKILVSSFYTYSLTDPEIGTIDGGQSKITAPHIMEQKLNALKAMLFYLDKYKPANRKSEVIK